MREPKTFFVQATANALPFRRNWFHCVATSIPYYRQRKYGDDGREIGREQTPDEFVSGIADEFDAIAPHVRADGVVFLNVGDTYSTAAGAKNANGSGKSGLRAGDVARGYTDEQVKRYAANEGRKREAYNRGRAVKIDLPDKSLIGIPWRIALEMQRRGWVLRAEIIWAKSISFGDAHADNVRRAVRAAARREGMSKEQAARIADAVEPQVGACMPSSVRDRPTVSHETVFMFAGSPDYFADFEALKERGKDWGSRDRSDWKYTQAGYAAALAPHNGCKDNNFAEKGRNVRSVWTINTQPYRGSGHYATYPERLAEKMIRAGTSDGGCCACCGAPFERVTEREAVKRSRPNEYVKRTGAAGTGNKVANTVSGVATRTLGFRASCSCGPAQGVTTPIPVPCRVLDPFGGVATTALAANALGRDAVIVDLYPKYLIEGRNRLLRRRADGDKVIPTDRETDRPEPDQLLIEA